jgi:hypothetical protein
MIINYFRYVNDILLTFDSNQTNIQAILTDFNSIRPNLHFTTEAEQNNKINYLDISIKKCIQYKNTHLQKNPHLPILSFPTLPTIPLNINMLQLDTYIVDYTH